MDFVMSIASKDSAVFERIKIPFHGSSSRDILQGHDGRGSAFFLEKKKHKTHACYFSKVLYFIAVLRKGDAKKIMHMI